MPTTSERTARRATERAARKARAATVEAICLLDDLLDDAGEALSVPERASLRTALDLLLAASGRFDEQPALTAAPPLPREVTG